VHSARRAGDPRKSLRRCHRDRYGGRGGRERGLITGGYGLLAICSAAKVNVAVVDRLW
jgi:hypothetical protein